MAAATAAAAPNKRDALVFDVRALHWWPKEFIQKTISDEMNSFMLKLMLYIHWSEDGSRITDT